MFTTFEAGETNYKLRFTTNALCEFESRYQIGILNALQNEKNIYFTRGILWAGLLDQNPKLTTAETGEIIDAFFAAGHSLKDLMKVINGALMASGFFFTSGSEKAKNKEKV